MFADDTKVFRTIECQNDQCILQGDLHELTEWSRKCLLTFIVFNAPEPDTNLKDIRVRADLEMVRGLCNDACGIDVDTANDVKMVIRLWKKKRGMKNLGPSKWK